jgi:hypothetical protein
MLAVRRGLLLHDQPGVSVTTTCIYPGCGRRIGSKSDEHHPLSCGKTICDAYAQGVEDERKRPGTVVRSEKIARVRELLEYAERELARPQTGFAPEDCQTSDSIFHAHWEIVELLFDLGVLPMSPAQALSHDPVRP